MHTQPWKGGMTLLLALALLLQPRPLAALPSAPEQPARPQQATRRSIYLPLIDTDPGPPAFSISSPGAGWSLAGSSQFAIQPTSSAPITSVSFAAGSTSLGVDSTPADGFRVFLDARSLPAGPLTLSATASGPGGRTSKSVAVTVVRMPSRSGTVGPAGGVFASQTGSVVTIPPGALPNGTQVSVTERSQQEITARHGIEWEKLGVTFLGHQDVTAGAEFALPLRTSSAGFGPRVQPGQAVVNYQIMPDADGDGVDELIVVNTASVAPTGDVVSDAVPQVQIDTVELAGRTTKLRPSQTTTLGGPPGTAIEFAVNEFNLLSIASNAIDWTCADGEQISVPGSVQPNEDDLQSQIFSTIIPNCTPGVAQVRLRNLSTGSSGSPFMIQVTAPQPLSGPPGTRTLAFLDATEEEIDALPGTLDSPELPPTWKQDTKDDLAEARRDIEERMADPDPQNQEGLRKSDELLPEPEDAASAPQARAAARPSAACVSKEDKERLRQDMDHYLTLSSVAYNMGIRKLGDKYWRLAQIIWRVLQLPTCEKKKPPRLCKPSPSGGGGSRGSGSAPPPGGNGCGNAGGGGPSGVRAAGPAQAASRIFVKVYSGGSPLPFTGMADPGGYFFIPLIPQDEPFLAVAYDQSSGQTRSFRGIGPKVGESVLMFFDFTRPDPNAATLRWDGGGDGVSWFDRLNWETDILPTADNDVLIDVPGTPTITFDSPISTVAVRSLRSAEHLTISSGQLELVGTSIVTGGLRLESGTLSVVGNLTVSGPLVWTGGNLTGSGTTIASGGLELSGGATKLLDGHRLENARTATWSDGPLSDINGGQVINRAGATLTISHDAFFSGTTGQVGLVNAGTLVRSTTAGVTTINASVTSSGTIQVESGTLRLNGGGSYSGQLSGAGVLELYGGTHTLAASSRLGGNLVVNNTADVTVAGSFATSSATLSGGTLRLAAGLSASSTRLTLSGGTLDGAGNLTVSGPTVWTGGIQRGSGAPVALGGLELSGGGTKQLLGRRLENGGTASWSDGQLSVLSGGQVVNRAGATLTISHDAFLSGTVGQVGLVNAGTLVRSSTTGVTTVSVGVSNSGMVRVESGTLLLNGGGSNSGTMTISGGQTLDLNGVFENQATGRIGGSGTLELRNATFTNSGTIDPTVIIQN
jgi:hypothetical protein